MKFMTMEKKIKVLEHAFAASAGAYYNINLTRNLVPDSMYQVIEDEEYSLNKQLGLPENAAFTEVISFWGEKLDPADQPAYYEFFSIPRLLKVFQQGKTHECFQYWTKTAFFQPMLAEQHIVMYQDETTEDILAITYVLDLTQKAKEEQYKKELEEKQKKLEAALVKAEKVRQYREIQAAVDAVDDVLNKLAVFDRISSEEELNQALPDLLESLGRYSMSDRAYIFTWASTECQTLRMTHEWCADGITPSMGEMQNLRLCDMPNWTPRLKRGEAIVFADWDAEKEKNSEEYAIFDGQQIHSLIVIPIFANKTLNGYVGFDNPEQSKAALSLRLLSSIGGHISSLKDNFFMRQQLEEKQQSLEKGLQELNEEKRVLEALSKDYTSVYLCDFEKNDMLPLIQKLDSNSYVVNRGLKEGQRAYTTRMKYYYDHFVIKESAPDFLEKMSTENIREYLSTHDRFAYRYQAYPNPAGQQYFEIQMVPLTRAKDSKIVMGYRYIDDLVAREKERNQQKEILSKSSQILSGLSVDYTTAFVVNLDTDAYEFAFNKETNHAQTVNGISKFADYVQRYADDFALPESREAMKLNLSSAFIKKQFEKVDDYHFSFETEPNAAGLSCFQAHIVKQYDGENHFAFLGFRSVDEIVKQERFYKDALQEANQALQEQLELITNSLPGGVKISNDDEVYSFKYVSEQFANMLGYETPEELMKASGGTIVGLAHPDDLETGIADALEQYTRANHYATTYRMKCKDGSWKYIEDRGQKVRNPDGSIEHWNLILDKNELMEKTIALECEKRENQEKSAFLSRMSHDMRTPLNGIIGLLDICKKHPEDRELVDASRLKARIAADHLLSLINDTLELSKLENKDVSLYQEVFYMPTVIREVETIAQMRADEENKNLFFEGDADCLKQPYLVGSPLYVKQILLNLITNAIKYNRENGSVYCSLLEKELSETEVAIEFTIRDTGIGMKQEFLKDIFKPFVQADNGPRSTYMGTGLGMAIVKNLVDRMNGTIEIESVEGEGTAVNVVLPFKIADTGTDKENKKEEEKRGLQGKRILLAEDNALNREIAVFFLKDEGIEVTEVMDGKQAVFHFLNKPEYYFDAILLDIMMPVMDGYQAARTIRNCCREDAKTIPIIAMTANAFDDDRRKSEAVGMNAHLSKPLDVQKLMKTIEELCD